MIFKLKFFKAPEKENIQVLMLNFKHSVRFQGEATQILLNASVNSGHAQPGAEDEIICYWRGKLNKQNKIDLLNPVAFKGW